MKSYILAILGIFTVVACGSASNDPSESNTQATAKLSPDCNLIESTGIHAMCVSQGTGGGKPSPAPTASAYPSSCLDVAGSWAMATPGCGGEEDGGAYYTGSPDASLNPCQLGWAVWEQMQAAGCTIPRQVVYTTMMGAFYSWCPPGDYAETGTTIPGGCPVTASSVAALTQLVLWTPLEGGDGTGPHTEPGGCKIPACLTDTQ